MTPPAKRLLELLSCLAPDPLPREWFTEAETAKHWTAAGVPAPEDALAELADFSLAKLTGDAVQFHRLVQEITRGRWTEIERIERLRGMLAVVNALPWENPHDVRSWPRWIPAAPHVDILVQRADARAIAEPTSRLMNELGLFYAARIRVRDAERLHRRALAIDAQSFGPEHPHVAIRLNNLAALLQATNRLAEAEPLLRRALRIFHDSLGPEHPNTQTVQRNYTLLPTALDLPADEVTRRLQAALHGEPRA